MSTAPLHAPLVSRTIPVADPGPLLRLLPEVFPLGHGLRPRHPLAWVRRGEGLVAWGEVARIRTSGPGRFGDAAAAWSELTAHAAVRDEVGLPGTGPIAFGSFAFADGSPANSGLVVPEVVVGHRGGRWWLTTMGAGAVLPAAPAPTPAPEPADWGAVRFGAGALDRPRWTAAVARAVAAIQDGRLDKVVLARDVRAHADEPVDPRLLLRRLASDYPGCWTFSVDGLLGATPELLVRREKGLVTSRVLAGTIRRTGDDARDLALAASLARSSKDREEHEYAVASVTETLQRHCSSTNRPESPYVLHLANVMHLATDVTGVCVDGASALDLAGALHPSAAVCGTPRGDAAALIAELEGMDRDRYAGPVGWVDAAGDGEFGIALRCGLLDDADPRALRLFAGCGIVAGSDPAAELAESEAKLVPMRQALLGG